MAALTDLSGVPWIRLSVRNAAWVVFGCVAASSVLIASVDATDVFPLMFQWAAVPVLGALTISIVPQIDALIVAVGRGQNAWPAPSARTVQAIGDAVRYLGKASYSVYLWHCLVIAGFVQLGWSGADFGWLLMLVTSLICGVLSWQFIERRFYNFS